jgi:hypothetical protein
MDLFCVVCEPAVAPCEHRTEMFGFHKTKDNFVACSGDIPFSVELFYEAVWRQGAWGDGDS